MASQGTGIRSSRADLRKTTGAHYTPPELAAFVADRLIDSLLHKSESPLRILDPACGDGELLLACADALDSRGQSAHLIGYDTSASAIEIAHERLTSATRTSDLSFDLDVRDFLVNDGSRERVHAIIANPPYVRTQHLGAKKAQAIAKQLSIGDRVDLYQAFIILAETTLEPSGSLALITSNRFLTTRTGAFTRAFLRDKFEIEDLIDLGDTKVFSASVLPCLIFAQLSPGGSTGFRLTSIYETSQQATDEIGLYDALRNKSVSSTAVAGKVFSISRGHVDASKDPLVPWVASSADSNWLSIVEKNAVLKFGDIDKIRVGVKTTADSVFIRDDWESLPDEMRPEPELLLPLISSDTAQRWESKPGRKRILYPYDLESSKRRPVDLDHFPRTRLYLQQHYERLAGRTYVIEGGRQWWEIWVPQKPAAWAAPKMVFPDISEVPRFSIDLSGGIVNGNCYWLAPEDPDLAYLMTAVANSSLGVRFYDAVCGNRLYSGRRRFMTQYVSRYPVPDPQLPASQKLISIARELYNHGSSVPLELEVDALVEQAFGLEQ